jgi:hypothetical protein
LLLTVDTLQRLVVRIQKDIMTNDDTPKDKDSSSSSSRSLDGFVTSLTKDTPKDKDSSSTYLDGFVSSLTLALPASLHRILDEQRIARLSQCQKLEQVLAECREQREPRSQLEDFPMGIRMVRYFHWRDLPEETPCLREEHALWACRAVALQCGPDLVQLRDCFQTNGPDTILSQAGTSYQGKSESTCRELESKLGACVRRKAIALESRHSSSQA